MGRPSKISGTALSYGQYGAPSFSPAVVAAVPIAMWQPAGVAPTRPTCVAVAAQPVPVAVVTEYVTPCDASNCVVLNEVVYVVRSAKYASSATTRLRRSVLRVAR